MIGASYHWLGMASCAIVLATFAFYELLPSPRMEHGLNPEDTWKIWKHGPCPCGSGEKFKRCCGKNV